MLSMRRSVSTSRDKKTVINENFDDAKTLEAMVDYNTLTFTGENDEKKNLKKKKKNSIDENQVYGYDRNLKNVVDSKRNDLFLEDPRVQVQEETGSQRVQVSNGYQEPFNLDEANGVRSESGQVLEWALTFWGTGTDDDET